MERASSIRDPHHANLIKIPRAIKNRTLRLILQDYSGTSNDHYGRRVRGTAWSGGDGGRGRSDGLAGDAG